MKLHEIFTSNTKLWPNLQHIRVTLQKTLRYPPTENGYHNTSTTCEHLQTPSTSFQISRGASAAISQPEAGWRAGPWARGVREPKNRDTQRRSGRGRMIFGGYLETTCYYSSVLRRGSTGILVLACWYLGVQRLGWRSGWLAYTNRCFGAACSDEEERETRGRERD